MTVTVTTATSADPRPARQRNSNIAMLQNGSVPYENKIYEMGLALEDTMEHDPQLDGSITFLTNITENKGLTDTAFGIDNPIFSTDDEQNTSMKFTPWLYNEDAVVPSQRARVQIPYSPSNIKRLSPLRVSSRSINSFMINDGMEEQPKSFLTETTNM